MDSATKRKVTVKANLSLPSSPRPPSRNTPYANVSRPGSPIKQHVSAQSTLSPSVRLKAKVNSSAMTRKLPSTASSIVSSSASKGSVISSGRSYGSTTSTPRAVSPVRPTARMTTNGQLPSPSLASRPKARSVINSSLRPHNSQSAPGSPALLPHRRAVTAGTADSGIVNHEKRTRPASVSLHHAVSFSALGETSSSSVPGSPVSATSSQWSPHEHDRSPSQVGTGPKIKAKVSGLVKQTIDSLSPSSSITTPRGINVRARAPSISAPHSAGLPTPEYTLYPITTASPAANPHRFATARPPPSAPNYHHYQAFPIHDDTHINYGRQNVNGLFRTADPTIVPLPPQSPPASAVSFSSRSSISKSSVSFSTETSGDSHSNVSSRLIRNNGMSPGPVESHSGDSGHEREDDGEFDDDNDGNRKVRAEAKSIRKIADLEISNRSLLAINVSLETTKHRQAKEIRELRRKLRESRLILPPRTYREVTSLDADTTQQDEEDDEEEEEDEAEDESKLDGDEMYKRIKLILEGLLETGRRALETTPEDFLEKPKGGAKVLSADEVRNWRYSGDGASDTEDRHSEGHHDHDIDLDSENGGIPRTASSYSPTIPRSEDDSFMSEDEVEAMTLRRDSTSPIPPPILVTESP